MISILIRSLYLYQHAGDTWESILKSKVVAEKGFIPWFIHPTSIVGWYPLSDASGEAVLLSSLFVTTELSVKSMVVLLPIYFAIMGILFMFLLSRAISSDKFFQLLVIAIFPFYRYPIGITFDSLATRGLFLMFLPIVFFIFVKYFNNSIDKNKNDYRYFTMLLLFTFILCSIHRLFNYFLFCVIAPLFLTYFYNKLIQTNYGTYLNNYRYQLIFLFSLFTIQIFNITIRDFDSQKSLTQKFTQGVLPQELDTGVGIINTMSFYLFKTGNLIFDYTYWYNITTVFLIFGIFHLLKTKNKFSNFFFVSFSICTLFVLDIQYFLIYFSPLCAIYSSLGIIYLTKHTKSKSLWILSISCIILGGSTLTIFYVNKEGIVSGLPLLIFFFSGSFLLIKYGLVFSKQKIREFTAIFLVSILFINFSYSLIPTLLYADKVTDQMHEGEGDMFREYQGYDQAAWVGTYLEDPFLETSPYERNLIWTLTGVPSAMNFYDLVGNPILIEDMDAEWNISTFTQTGRYLFSKDYEDHHYPRNLRNYVFSKDDSYWAERYDVNWLIVTRSESDPLTCYSCFDNLDKIFEERYEVYEDQRISIVFYDYYS